MNQPASSGFRVTAPASTSNLGVGFDCMGVTIDLHNMLTVRPGTGRVAVEGEGAATLPRNAGNLVMRCLADVAPSHASRVDLRCVNRIPPARGLGSSTAAAALGFIAGWRLDGHAWTPDELFERLAALDGHPDNAAPCAYGGSTLSPPALVAAGEAPLALPLPEWLACVFVVPQRTVPTDEARAALPLNYTREHCVTALGNAAGLVAALAAGDETALRRLLQADVVHEPQRSGLIPELAEIRMLTAGMPTLATTVSGAGPTIAVWCRREARDGLAARLRDATARALPGATVLAVELATPGASCG